MSAKLKAKAYDIIFEADTNAGRNFDVGLLIVILLSIIIVMLESVPSIKKDYESLLKATEWVVTGIFTLEYLTRILIVKKPLKYIFSFFGIIDLLSIMPTFLSLFIGVNHGLTVIRALRLLRIFRVLHLPKYLNESKTIGLALIKSRHKISVFFFTIVVLVLIIGTIMYLVEGKESGFTSIPQSVYWAIVTITTVGYGDIAPITVTGKVIASFMMIIGYAIIAVPTGIITAQLTNTKEVDLAARVCQNCFNEGHTDDALYCKHCGGILD